MRTAIDSNVLSALLGVEASMERVAEALDAAALEGGLAISPVVYVELRAHPAATASFIDEFLATTRVAVDWNLGKNVWNLAAERFARYAERRRLESAGQPKRLAADFLIAAHACVYAGRLITLDQRRYRTDFPELRLVEP